MPPRSHGGLPAAGFSVRLLPHVTLETAAGGDIAIAFDGHSVGIGKLSAKWARPDLEIVAEALNYYFEENPGPARRIIEKTINAARAHSGFFRMRTVTSVTTPSNPSDPVTMPRRS